MARFRSILATAALLSLSVAPAFARPEGESAPAKLSPKVAISILRALTPPPIPDGPLTPLMNVGLRTDSNGYLITMTGACAGSDGPLTPGGNIRVRTDSNGYLITCIGGSAGATFLASDGTAAAPSYSFASQTNKGLYSSATDQISVSLAGAQSHLFYVGGLSVIGGSAVLTLGADVNLYRDVVANTLAQRNGTNAQTFRVYNTYTDASNYERFTALWTTNQIYLITQNAGTGTARNLIVGSAADLYLRAGGTERWVVPTSGHFTAASDNTYDIGASGATRPRTGYFGTSVVSPILQGSGTGTSVANVGANSCGTSAASIAGNQVSGVITVGATAGTQCRVTFTTAAPVARDCTVTDSTTTIATRATVVDVSNTDFLGAFVAGDKVTFICMVR